MKQKRKNRFFTFIFSFLPGAAEMYMGFMRNGLSLMLLFVLSFTPVFYFSTFEFLTVIGVVVWFFGFFHARNYASMDEQEFAAMTDLYIWEEFADIKAVRLSNNTAKKWVAAFLIVIGVAQLWMYFSDFIYHLIPDRYWEDLYPMIRNIPQVIISILLIMIGVKMIAGKKKELENTLDVEGQFLEITQKQDSDSKEA